MGLGSLRRQLQQTTTAGEAATGADHTTCCFREQPFHAGANADDMKRVFMIGHLAVNGSCFTNDISAPVSQPNPGRDSEVLFHPRHHKSGSFFKCRGAFPITG